jgi:hypothetical protein
LCNLIKCSLLIIALTLAELSSIQTLANQFQFTISKTEDSISGVMENVVNPCVLIISTHLEESRSVTTKSADFGVDERERHLKVLVLVSGERVGVSTVERVTGILNTPETESTAKVTETFKFPIGCCIVILTKCSKEKLTFAGGEVVDAAGCGVGHWCVFLDPFIIP